MSRHRRSQLVVIAEREVSLHGRVVPYVVKRSAVARQVRLEIRSGQALTVILPRRCHIEVVDEMLQSKSRWIVDKMDRFATPTVPAGNGRLKVGDTIPYLGQDVRIASSESMRAGERVQLEGQTLTIHGGQAASHLELSVERWYRARAACLLEQKARSIAEATGVQFSRFLIRGQKTRWGSCSQRGTLSFNWRLVMAPEPVIDYVVIHEVAHLKEMNHTKRFWRLVAERCASWREHKKWLNDHGPELAAVLSAPQ